VKHDLFGKPVFRIMLWRAAYRSAPKIIMPPPITTTASSKTV